MRLRARASAGGGVPGRVGGVVGNQAEPESQSEEQTQQARRLGEAWIVAPRRNCSSSARQESPERLLLCQKSSGSTTKKRSVWVRRKRRKNAITTQPVTAETTTPDQERQLHLRRQAAVLVQVVEGFGAAPARAGVESRKEKRAAVSRSNSAEQAGGDGDAAAGNAGNDRQRLRRADRERIRQRDFAQILLRAAQPVGHLHHQAHQDQHGADHVGTAPGGLRLFLEDVAQHRLPGCVASTSSHSRLAGSGRSRGSRP